MFFSIRDLLVNYYNIKSLRLYYHSDKRILLHLIKDLFFRKSVVVGEKKKCLWSVSLKRKDYLTLFEQINNQIRMEKAEINIEEKNCINVYAFFSFFFHIIHLFKLRRLDLNIGTSNHFKLKIHEQIMLYLYNLKFYDYVRAIRRFGTEGVKYFVSLCDATWNKENAIVRFLNKKGVVTITCQHGVYRPFVDEESIDIFCMVDTPSQIRLAWGDAHNSIFEKYSPGMKNVICGNPQLEPYQGKYSLGIIGVATDQPRFKEYNQTVIKIVQAFAERNGYKIKWRMHPFDSVENYTFNKSIIKLDSNLDDCEFIVAHTTTMFFSYLARGIKAIRYKSDVPFFDLDESIQFSNQKEFDDIVRDMDSIDFSQISKPFIECIGEESKKKYTSFFNSVI